MTPGDIVLIRFPQSDLREGKLRPALVIAVVPDRHSDILLAAISSRLYQAVDGFDETISPSDDDFPRSGLKVSSAIRLTRLAGVETSTINARLGQISAERLDRVKGALASWLLT